KDTMSHQMRPWPSW
ncbi:phosphoribosylaminoimidazole-succinocarboxamide synthase domain protein, partial [Vibrio parahaemolyticus V-223/04]